MSPLPTNHSSTPAASRLAVIGYRLLDLIDRAWRKWHRSRDRAAAKRHPADR